MEIKLNIYKDEKLKELEKTYIANDFELSTGVIEDIMNCINIDAFEGGLEALSDEGQISTIVPMIYGAYGTFKNLLKNAFDGLTDDEIKRTKIKEVAKVVIDIIKYSFAELGKAVGFSNSKTKN